MTKEDLKHSYGNLIIKNGKMYPYYEKHHQKQLEDGEVYAMSEAVAELRRRKRGEKNE